jgi:hypothetical protein
MRLSSSLFGRWASIGHRARLQANRLAARRPRQLLRRPRQRIL